MPWYREYLGRVDHDGLIHLVYAWRKDDRVNWDSQCGLAWSHRDNRDQARAPKTTRRPATCVRCLSLSLRLGHPT